MRYLNSAALFLVITGGAIAFFPRIVSAVPSHSTASLAQLPVLDEPADPPAPTTPSESIPEPDPVETVPDDVAEPEVETAPELITAPEAFTFPPADLQADPNPLNFPAVPEEVNIDIVREITLEEAVELAYRNSQSLQVALLEQARAEAAVDEARAALYPTLNSSANLTTQENPGGGLGDLGSQLGLEDSSSGVDTTLGSSLDLSYDVFTSGRRGALIRAAEQQLRFNELEVERVQEQLRLDTANLYYVLQEASEQIRINQAFLDEAERNLRDTRIRQREGVGTRFDVLRAEVQFANARQSLIQSQGQERIAQRDLARLLNLPPTAGVQATAVEIAENWPLTLEESIILAFQNRAELEQQLLQRDIFDQQRIVALAAVRPQVSLFANYGLQNVLDDSDSGFNDNYSFGARFNMTLFDGGAARANARQQERNSEIAEQQFSETQDQVRFQVEQAYFDLETNQENIGTAQIAVRQAEEALRLANLRQEAGVGTQLDVLTAQSELTQAEVNLVQAILGYNRALVALQRAISNLGSTL